MKREVHARYYGRYVDDAIVISPDRDWLLSLIPRIREFLSDRLALTLHEGKTTVADVYQGVEFLGAYIRPWRTYLSRHTLRRIARNVRALQGQPRPLIRRSVSSYLGIFCHTSSHRQARRLLSQPHILQASPPSRLLWLSHNP